MLRTYVVCDDCGKVIGKDADHEASYYRVIADRCRTDRHGSYKTDVPIQYDVFTEKQVFTKHLCPRCFETVRRTEIW